MNLGFLKIGAQSWLSFMMPSQSSTMAAGVDNLFYFITWLCLIFFVAIVAAMVYFVVKYRRKSPDQKTSDITGNHTLEIAWSVFPGMLLVVIFVWGFLDWAKMVIPPADSLEVRVLGQKWNWAFSYPKEGINASTLVVPINRPVKLIMSSKDVLHSFFVPAFRIKRDVLPNRYSVLWFEPIEEGTFDIYCTEYCGTSHSTMLAKVKVVSDAAYAEWISEGGDSGGKGLSAAAFGKQLSEQKGCVACHSDDGSVKIGPSFAKLFGKQEALADGSTVTVDDNYIRESIMVPGVKVVKGFQPVMPSFQGQLTDKQVDAFIEYIKSLSQ